ncbi:MAG: hypothetical protein HDS11_04090 [Bacteroides sp.]|nr:hypothetical protein [Bacteroides sp.]
MPEVKLRDEILNKGLTINVVASYVLKKAEPSTVQDTNKALLLALEETKLEWKNSSIYEKNALNLLSEIDLPKRHPITTQVNILANLQKVYKCLDSRGYQDIIGYSYAETLKIFVFEVLNLMKKIILSVDTVFLTRNLNVQGVINYSLTQQSTVQEEYDEQNRAYELLQYWANTERSFWPLFEKSNRRNS